MSDDHRLKLDREGRDQDRPWAKGATLATAAWQGASVTVHLIDGTELTGRLGAAPSLVDEGALHLYTPAGSGGTATWVPASRIDYVTVDYELVDPAELQPGRHESVRDRDDDRFDVSASGQIATCRSCGAVFRSSRGGFDGYHERGCTAEVGHA